jgi:hypothetical protein
MSKPARDPATLRALAKEMETRARRAARNQASLSKWADESGGDSHDRDMCRRDAARYEGEASFAFRLAASLRSRATRSERS